MSSVYVNFHVGGVADAMVIGEDLGGGKRGGGRGRRIVEVRGQPC
jgi:hypothetical protein